MHRSIATRRLVAVTLLVMIAAVGSACGTGTPATAAPSTAADASPSTATATPSPSPTPAPTEAPTPTPTSDPTPVASSGTVIADLTPPQLFLLAGVRDDLRGDCRPAVELPEGATAGIQCEAAEPIDAVGFYLFADRKVMRQTYFARLAEHGVKADAGNACQDGKPGESTDIPGNVGFEQRVGCYIDASGIANVRISVPSAVPGQSVYIGVNGTSGDLGAVVGWLNNTEPGMVGCGYCVDLWTDPTGAS